MIPESFPACRVGIVDYQAGNVQSIGNAFEHLGATVVRIHGREDADACTHLVLPGVGAFGFCAERLEESGMLASLEHWAFALRRPLLGICVGMQLLAEGSDESPGARGLGWAGGRVRRIRNATREIRVPHVGWNTVCFQEAHGDYKEGESADFYFDHSFALMDPTRAVTLAYCEHGDRFSAALRRDNIVAAQFHPEKSQAAGMRFLRGFLAT